MDNMADNAFAATEEIAEGMTEETGAAAGDGTTGSEQPAEQNTHDTQTESNEDITKTRAFAQRLRERTDKEIAAAGLVNPYTGEAVRNAADLRALRRMQEAESNGGDPEYAAEKAALVEQLGEYRIREQESMILSDPALAPYYEEYRDDVLAIAQGVSASGNDVDLGLALRIIMAQNYDEIRKRDAERIRQETIRHYNAQSKASPGSIGGSETPSADIDFSRMSDEEFEKYKESIKQGRRHLN